MEWDIPQGAVEKGSFTANTDQTGEESEDQAAGQTATRMRAALFILMVKFRMKPKGGICMHTRVGSSHMSASFHGKTH